jgi:predicted N-acetyltransferase YhbS
MESEDIADVFDVDRSITGEERAISFINLITEDLKGELDLSFVAEVNSRVVGFISAMHTYIGEPVLEAGLIQGIGVHPLYQQQGIGAQLVNTFTEHCKSKGIRNLRVILSQHDSKMTEFFSQMNFRKAELVVYDKIL